MIAIDQDSPTPAGRPVVGRHVLGSSPDSLEPSDSAIPPALSQDPEGRALEPCCTIYLPEWSAARRRAQATAPAIRGPLVAALDHVEAGWDHMRALQRWYEDNRERSFVPDEYGHLLSFIDGDLVDLFRVLAFGVAELVPGYPGWEDTADPGDVDGELSCFHRYLVVFILAVEQATDAQPMRELVRSTAAGLAGWCTELAVLVAAIDETVLRPVLDASASPSHLGTDA